MEPSRICEFPLGLLRKAEVRPLSGWGLRLRVGMRGEVRR